MKKLFNRNSDTGFTLVELLIVVAIIGIIAAIAIPNLLSAIQRGKQKRTMGDIKTSASALETYNTDNNSYPSAAFAAMTATTSPYGTFTAGTPPTGGLNPDYMVTPIWKDGWSTAAGSNPLYYGTLTTGSSATDYIICSMGKAGGATAHAVTGAVPAGCVAVTAANTGSSIKGGDGTSFNCDISIVDGQFIQAPNGKQSNVTPCP